MKTLRSDIYDKAQTLEERREAVRKLMESGWILCCWRKSSPHNWFLQHPKDKYQSDVIDLEPDDFDWSWIRKLRDSAQRVIQYWGSDSGKPVLTKYALRKRPYKERAYDGKGTVLLYKGWFQVEQILKKKKR